MNENKTNINWYPGHMAKAKRLMREQMNVIDLIYEVIDARIPFSSKLQDIDHIIGNKPRLLIFSKWDLCDHEVSKKWMTHYEKLGYQVVTADLTTPTSKKKILNATKEVMQSSMEMRQKKGMKERKIRVLVVGVPNAGKSTLINILSGKKVANVGNRPGITTTLHWTRVSDEVELLDSPGVLWPKLDQEKVALNLASFTAIKEEILPTYDVICYIIQMLYRYYPKILEERYGVSMVEDDMISVLDEIGRRRGCIIKGGEIDYDRVMGLILNDIKTGAIKGITFDQGENL